MSRDAVRRIGRETTQRTYDELIPKEVITLIEVAPEEFSEKAWIRQRIARSLSIRPHFMQLLEVERVQMVLFGSSIGRVPDTREALRLAARAARYVLVYDNLMAPQPEWMPDTVERRHVCWPDLMEMAEAEGLRLIGYRTGDVLGRKLFLLLPSWLHWLAEFVTWGVDVRVAPWMRVWYARHSGWLFESVQNDASQG